MSHLKKNIENYIFNSMSCTKKYENCSRVRNMYHACSKASYGIEQGEISPVIPCN